MQIFSSFLSRPGPALVHFFQPNPFSLVRLHPLLKASLDEAQGPGFTRTQRARVRSEKTRKISIRSVNKICTHAEEDLQPSHTPEKSDIQIRTLSLTFSPPRPHYFSRETAAEFLCIAQFRREIHPPSRLNPITGNRSADREAKREKCSRGPVNNLCLNMIGATGGTLARNKWKRESCATIRCTSYYTLCIVIVTYVCVRTRVPRTQHSTHAFHCKQARAHDDNNGIEIGPKSGE